MLFQLSLNIRSFFPDARVPLEAQDARVSTKQITGEELVSLSEPPGVYSPSAAFSSGKGMIDPRLIARQSSKISVSSFHRSGKHIRAITIYEWPSVRSERSGGSRNSRGCPAENRVTSEFPLSPGKTTACSFERV